MAENKLALAIRHVHFENCGTLEEVLRERGFAVRYVEAGRESLRELDLPAAQLVVSLGGPVSVYDDSRYPWIRDELNCLERSIAQRKPTLGICLGAQMLAHVLGARVYPGPCKELGWKPLLLTEHGKRSSIAPLAPDATSLLHWHGDTFDLPAQGTLLASTPEVPQQIFEWGGHVIGFQCHPEVRAADIESWLIGHAFEIGATADVDVNELRRDTARLGPTLERQARRAFSDWLLAVGL
jgi:GMP synthase (glutamine-hydrolysing)